MWEAAAKLKDAKERQSEEGREERLETRGGKERERAGLAKEETSACTAAMQERGRRVSMR